ncbi:MAG: diguanylate cyclase [Verrucomicrobiota bacterium]
MKILVADGNSISRETMRKYLQDWGYEVVAVENGRQAIEILQGEDPPSIALLDHDLPQIDGIAVCKALGDSYKSDLTHKILLSHPSEMENLLPALKSGVNDFYTKPIHLHELRARLFVAFQTVEAKQAAMKDSLTGLYNRRYFEEQGKREFNRALRHQHPLSIIMLDADHFKKINDQYGHFAGDVVLKKIAICCQSNLRPEDVLCRWGGEEFVAILPATTGEKALQVAERLREAVSKLNILVEGLRSVKCTASFGVAEMTLGDIHHIQSAMNVAHPREGLASKDSQKDAHPLARAQSLADHAAYEAKEAGRDLVILRTENVSYLGESFFRETSLPGRDSSQYQAGSSQTNLFRK